MGINGTEITKQVADIILADDNFATIVIAVEEGRRIYDNIMKFIVYLLSCNGVEVLIMLSAVLFVLPVPFFVMMLLYANIFVDVPPSLSIGVDPMERDTMQRPPRDPNEKIFNKPRTLTVLFNSCEMTFIVLMVYWYTLYHRHQNVDYHTRLRYAQSLAFLLLATLHLIHSFLTRSVLNTLFAKDIFSNRWMIFSFFVSLFFMVVGVYMPGFNNHILEVVPLKADDWLIIFIVVIFHISVVECCKFGLRHYFKQQNIANFDSKSVPQQQQQQQQHHRRRQHILPFNRYSALKDNNDD